ncbi:hypothetical protein L207DRAFT_452788 [Hyaloscypha variabilis F]|uniref:Uncharacterized protein n=1 Tax=Hyaloscypha variabilis (strain UAMH 11265 / GT02V1 / F) TaxID=1149755 RepID=A0A2J6S4H9_HYAVF|nr:hypothetical protein L207DRAFT_452788 [Hyaloscypha variabilis F]
MVLDPMSAVSLAGNIIQFIDFSCKIVSKGRRIYLSRDGALPKNLELEIITNDLSRLAKSLRNDKASIDTLTDDEKMVRTMSDDCTKIAEELLRRLEKLKVKSDVTQRGWKSARQALKSVWSGRELEEMSERLSALRNQIQFGILVSMKEGLERLEFQTSQQIREITGRLERVECPLTFPFQQWKEIDEQNRAAKSLLKSLEKANQMADSLKKVESPFTAQIHSHTVTITDLHLETRAIVEKEGSKTRMEIRNLLEASKFVSKDHEARCDVISSNPIETESSWNEHSKVEEMILQSLRFPTMEDRYEEIKEAHAKTFEWIFEKSNDTNRQWDDFSDWLQHGEGIYWISGKAGSGKSTLMRYIHDNPRLRTLLKQWTGENQDLISANFFFWIGGVSDQSSQVGLWRSLLFKLLCSKRHLIEATLPDLWSSLTASLLPIQYSQTYSWTLAKVTQGFKRFFSIISQDNAHVFLLIDGLDEYKGEPADTIELFRSIISPTVKICVSSRPWQDFDVAFKDAPQLRLQDLTFGDISRFVNDKLSSNEQMQQLYAIDHVGAPKLVQEIVERADGVFLWVWLVVRSFLSGLTNTDSISNLRERLKDMPPEIKDLYTHMLSKVKKMYYKEGRTLFSTVALAFYSEQKYEGDGICALRLSFAVGEDENLKAQRQLLTEEEVKRTVKQIDSRLKVCCGGLLEISSNHQSQVIQMGDLGNRAVKYIHRTARDYLSPGDSQKTPKWIQPVLTDGIYVRTMRANVLFLQSCIPRSKSKRSDGNMRGFLRPFTKRMMWVANQAERETLCHNAEILDAFKDSASLLFDSSVNWSNMVMSDEVTISSSHWLNQFLSMAIRWINWMWEDSCENLLGDRCT